MTSTPLRLAAVLTAALGAACSTTTAAPVWMAQSLGTRQCEEDASRTPQALAQALRTAGLTVQALACGHDGRMRPAVCGAGDGRLALVQLPEDQAARAQALGWVPLAGLRDAQRQPCP